MTTAEEIKQLRVANAALRKQLAQTTQQLAVSQRQLSELQQTVVALKADLHNLKTAKVKAVKTNLSDTPLAEPAPLENSSPNQLHTPANSSPKESTPPDSNPVSGSAVTVENLQQALAQAQARVKELEVRAAAAKTTPKWVRPTKEAKVPKARRKRASQHNQARQLEVATKPPLVHKLAACPTCAGQLSGQHLGSRRQIIEIPAPLPVEIIEHQLYRGWCSYCRQWHEARVDLSGQVVGQGRVGVRLASTIAYLRHTLRLPFRKIQACVANFWQLELSVGELVELLHRLSKQTAAQQKALKQQAQAHPNLHADETGWREDGANGYIWALATVGPEAVRYYEYHQSRSGQTAQAVVGKHYQGTLSTDFLGSYNECGTSHQRCWVHLLRDLHKLKDENPGNAAVEAWVGRVTALYREGQALSHSTNQKYRDLTATRLEGASHSLGLAYARIKGHPCKKLAARLLRFEDELFVFVRKVEVDADNNLAERSVRPMVVRRKISGGSRSAEGSKTTMGLASLFETWSARGLNPLLACQKLLAAPTPLPQL